MNDLIGYFIIRDFVIPIVIVVVVVIIYVIAALIQNRKK